MPNTAPNRASILFDVAMIGISAIAVAAGFGIEKVREGRSAALSDIRIYREERARVVRQLQDTPALSSATRINLQARIAQYSRDIAQSVGWLSLSPLRQFLGRPPTPED